MLYIVGDSANPGGHTDTRFYYRSIVNPMRALEKKGQGAAGPVKIIIMKRRA
jgi:hypothetical protein